MYGRMRTDSQTDSQTGRKADRDRQSASCAGLLLAGNNRKCMNVAMQPEFHD